MKNLLLMPSLICLLAMPHSLAAQNSIESASFGGYFETIHDSHGGIHSLSELVIDSLKPNSRGTGNFPPCSASGYFIAYFD